MTNDELVERVIGRMPYPTQVCKLDTTSEKSAIRFTWRGTRYRLSESGGVEEVQGAMLAGTDSAILLEALLR